MKDIGRKIAYRIVRIRNECFMRAGLKSYLLKPRFQKIIFVFHGIYQKRDLHLNSRFVSVDYFESFLQEIKRYNVLSLDQFYDHQFQSDTLNIALTFDDGYVNNFDLAVPLLTKYQIPATFFITPIHHLYPYLWPDFIDLAQRFAQESSVVFGGNVFVRNRRGGYMHHQTSLKHVLKGSSFEEIKLIFDQFENRQTFMTEDNAEYWELMDERQIKWIADEPLFEIGAHGLTHASLTALNRQEAKYEMKQSKLTLERICNRSIEAFAFPFGDHDDTLIQDAVAFGFNKILLVESNKDEVRVLPMVRERMVSNPHIPLDDQLACLLKGSYY